MVVFGKVEVSNEDTSIHTICNQSSQLIEEGGIKDNEQPDGGGLEDFKKQKELINKSKVKKRLGKEYDFKTMAPEEVERVKEDLRKIKKRERQKLMNKKRRMRNKMSKKMAKLQNEEEKSK